MVKELWNIIMLIAKYKYIKDNSIEDSFMEKVTANGETGHNTLAIMSMVIRKVKEYTNILQEKSLKASGFQEIWMGRGGLSRMESKH